MSMMEINGKQVEFKQGDTILDVAKSAGIHIPTLCHMNELSPTGACRLCVVEVEGAKALIPSCAYPASDGMKVQTHSPRAIRSRKTIVELLLSSHPDDCLYCVRSGCCDLQDLADKLGVRERRYSGDKNEYHLDVSSPSLIRDPSKCILCGKCVRYCEEVQGVSAIDFVNRGSQAIVGTAFEQGLNVSSCINCGQCIVVCPTGALRENSSAKEVVDALNDPEKFVVVQHAPAVSVTIAEEFGLKPGKDFQGALNASLRALGFDRVFDTSFSADLTIMEEASELVHRIKNNGPLPMMTSCSPGWIKYIEQFYPDLLPHLSTCKSPMQMLGAVIKSYFAQKQGLDPKNIYSVAIMPCTAKKFEAGRQEMLREDGEPDVDAVLTTRELARLISQRGIDVNNLEPEVCDNPLGQRSSAGKLFGASGGVMEAAVRTAHYLITGEEMEELKLQKLRGMKGIKEAKLEIGDLEVGVAVCSGLANAASMLDKIREGTADFHFMEVMTCPGGCIAGGGQPLGTDVEAAKARMKALYDIDRDENLRLSHRNESIEKLYKDFLGEPLSEVSHHLLHTKYQKRDVVA